MPLVSLTSSSWRNFPQKNEQQMLLQGNLLQSLKLTCTDSQALSKALWTVGSNIFLKLLCVFFETGNLLFPDEPTFVNQFTKKTRVLEISILYYYSNAFSKIGSCASTKVFEEALNAVKFLGWLKKFGPA